jgi:hypothetical protein
MFMLVSNHYSIDVIKLRYYMNTEKLLHVFNLINIFF